jgi:hypothetical protein
MAMSSQPPNERSARSERIAKATAVLRSIMRNQSIFEWNQRGEYCRFVLTCEVEWKAKANATGMVDF